MAAIDRSAKPEQSTCQWAGPRTRARDERGDAFLTRPIKGERPPYFWIDATYLKIRQGGRIVSVTVAVAVGVNTDGRREVLGVTFGASEAEPFWTEFLRDLVRCGLSGARLVISDAHEGIKAATARCHHH